MSKNIICIYRYCVLSKLIAFLDLVPYTLLFEFSKSSKLSLHNGVVDTPFFSGFCNFEIKMWRAGQIHMSRHFWVWLVSPSHPTSYQELLREVFDRARNLVWVELTIVIMLSKNSVPAKNILNRKLKIQIDSHISHSLYLHFHNSLR